MVRRPRWDHVITHTNGVNVMSSAPESQPWQEILDGSADVPIATQGSANKTDGDADWEDPFLSDEEYAAFLKDLYESRHRGYA